MHIPRWRNRLACCSSPLHPLLSLQCLMAAVEQQLVSSRLQTLTRPMAPNGTVGAWGMLPRSPLCMSLGSVHNPCLSVPPPALIVSQEMLVSPQLLHRNGIPVLRVVQKPGQFIINLPGMVWCSVRCTVERNRRDSTSQHSTARYGATLHGRGALHGMAGHCMACTARPAQHDMASCSMARHNAARHSVVQHNTAWQDTAVLRCGTAWYNMV